MGKVQEGNYCKSQENYLRCGLLTMRDSKQSSVIKNRDGSGLTSTLFNL